MRNQPFAAAGDDPFLPGLRAFASDFKLGKTTAVSALTYCLGRVEALDEQLQAFQALNPDALTTAQAIDDLFRSGTWLGPLMGVPVAIKDIIAVDGMPTTNGSLYPSEQLTGAQGRIVSRLRRAGCVIVGKTRTVEFALGATGVNEARGTPWNALDPETKRIPGGSSSGSAVATASGMCGFALGSDTGGSIRIPACYNGLFGHKTTVGLWPTDGVFPLSATLDSLGPLTRYADDAALIHEVITGEKLPAPPSLSSLILGRPKNYFFDNLDDGVSQAILRAIDQLESAGVRFKIFELPEAAERETLFPAIVPSELLSALTIDGFKKAEKNMDSVTRSRASAGLDTPAVAYLNAQTRRQELVKIAGEKMAGLDGWLTPTCPHLPCAVESLGDPDINAKALESSRNTQPINLFGQCATTLPVSVPGQSLPAGLQLITPPHTDARLLSMSIAVERALQD